MIDQDDASGPTPAPDDDAMTARLLRLASLRAGAPIEGEARIRRAVLDECRSVARGRRVRRRAAALAALLSTAAAVFAVVRFMPLRPASVPVASSVGTIERLDGAGATVRSTNWSAALALATTIRTGDRIETDQSSRAALQLSGGASLRIDRGSSVTVRSSRSVDLATGGVYVDAARDSTDLEIHTPFGTVRDVGTQFEVRLTVSSMRVRVRSGLIEVQRDARVSTARPGMELTIDGVRLRQRQVLPYGPEWEWAERLAPPLVIEGRSLATVLDDLCREQGWTLTFGDVALARESSGIILHGSVEGLEPAQAAAVVLATSGLAHRLEAGELLITRAVPR